MCIPSKCGTFGGDTSASDQLPYAVGAVAGSAVEVVAGVPAPSCIVLWHLLAAHRDWQASTARGCGGADACLARAGCGVEHSAATSCCIQRLHAVGLVGASCVLSALLLVWGACTHVPKSHHTWL